jgi:hypothetical protein
MDTVTYICSDLFRRVLVEETYGADTSISSILDGWCLFDEHLAWRVVIREPTNLGFDRVDKALSTTRPAGYVVSHKDLAGAAMRRAHCSSASSIVATQHTRSMRAQSSIVHASKWAS